MSRKVTIELPESQEIESRGVKVKLDWTKVPDEKLAALVVHYVQHGSHQRVGDAAASSSGKAFEAKTGKKHETTQELKDWSEKNGDEIAKQTRADMESAIIVIESGEVSARREATPKDPIGARAWIIALNRIKKNDKLDAAYKGADKEGKAKLRKAVFDKYEDSLRAQAKEQLEAEAKASDGVDVDDILGALED